MNVNALLTCLKELKSSGYHDESTVITEFCILDVNDFEMHFESCMGEVVGKVEYNDGEVSIWID